MTTFPSERQKTAQRLTRELQAFGANVTSVLPLANDKQLRFWVSDYKKNEVMQQLKDAGYEVLFLGMFPQPDVSTYSMGLVNSFEVNLPADRQAIPQDTTRRIPKDELASKDKPTAEYLAMKKAFGL